jgi:hypothetical protein
MKMSLHRFASARCLAFASVFAALLLLAGWTAPLKARAASSGPGVWNLLLFGNYDMLSGIDTQGLASGSGNNTFPNNFQNGYGAGLSVVYWFNDVVAFRVSAQGNFFQGQNGYSYAGNSLESAPLTGGFEVKLYGDPDYFLYGVIDAGAAYEDEVTGSSITLSNSLAHSWSAYGDVGLGVNLNWVFLEVKFAYLPQALPQYSNQNAFYYIPFTAGFNF